MSNDIPKNPLTGKPYFTISDGPWEGRWETINHKKPP